MLPCVLQDRDEFRRERKAITRTGQIKTEGARHEKDDRHALDDRTRYVLGWTNEAKVAALSRQAASLDRRIAAGRRLLDEIRGEQKQLREREGTPADPGLPDSGSDWRPLTIEIHRREQEHRSLESASDLLRTLSEQLASVEARLAQADGELQSARSDNAVAADKRGTAAGMLADARTLLAAMPEEAKARYFPALEAMREASASTAPVERRQPPGRHARVASGRRDRGQGLGGCARHHAPCAVQERLAVETSEVDVTSTRGEYRVMLELRADACRASKALQELLNENTIARSELRPQLNRERQEIPSARNDQPDRSAIDYKPGRTRLLASRPDVEVRDFVAACGLHEGALTGSDDEQIPKQVSPVKGDHRAVSRREGQTSGTRWTAVPTCHGVRISLPTAREDDSRTSLQGFGMQSAAEGKARVQVLAAAGLPVSAGVGEQRSRAFARGEEEAFGRARTNRPLRPGAVPQR